MIFAYHGIMPPFSDFGDIDSSVSGARLGRSRRSESPVPIYTCRTQRPRYLTTNSSCYGYSNYLVPGMSSDRPSRTTQRPRYLTTNSSCYGYSNYLVPGMSSDRPSRTTQRPRYLTTNSSCYGYSNYLIPGLSFDRSSCSSSGQGHGAGLHLHAVNGSSGSGLCDSEIYDSELSVTEPYVSEIYGIVPLLSAVRPRPESPLRPLSRPPAALCANTESSCEQPPTTVEDAHSDTESSCSYNVRRQPPATVEDVSIDAESSCSYNVWQQPPATVEDVSIDAESSWSYNVRRQPPATVEDVSIDAESSCSYNVLQQPPATVEDVSIDAESSWSHASRQQPSGTETDVYSRPVAADDPGRYAYEALRGPGTPRTIPLLCHTFRGQEELFAKTPALPGGNAAGWHQRAKMMKNLATSCSSSTSTQTPPPSGGGGSDDLPVFCSRWQSERLFSHEGGALQGEASDVRLEVPRGAVGKAERVSVRAAVCTGLDRAYDGLPALPRDEHIASPVAEYLAQTGAGVGGMGAGSDFRFRTPVRVFLPHFLPANFSPDRVHVYVFRRDGLGFVSLSRLQPQSKDNVERQPQTDAFFFFGAGDRVVVVTDHFSGYFCTHCQTSVAPQELNLVVFARHAEKARGGGRRVVDVRLELWDNRLDIKDFRQVGVVYRLCVSVVCVCVCVCSV